MRITIMCSAYIFALLALFAEPAGSLADESKKYTLAELIEKTLENSPALRASNSQKLAAQGELLQAKAYENPELLIESENFSGSNTYKGYRSAETTVGISQKFIRPEKYNAKADAAEYGANAINKVNDATRLELIKNTKIAYAALAASIENKKIAEAQKQLANRTLADVSKRVDAAASPLYQKSKAEVLSVTASMELQKSEAELVKARSNLALLWNESAESFEIDPTDFVNIYEVNLSEAELLSAIDSTPDALILSAMEQQAKFNYELEKANAIPDPTFSLGVRDIRETRDQALVASVSFPIPVFNQNSGNITNAKHKADEVAYSNKAKIAELKAQALNSLRQMQLSYHQAKELKEKLIPAADKAFRQTRAGFEKGKFPYLEVLDAERSLFEARYSLNDALKQFHTSRAEIERFLPEQNINQGN